MSQDAPPSNIAVAGFRVELFRSAPKGCSPACNSGSLDLAAAESQHQSAVCNMENIALCDIFKKFPKDSKIFNKGMPRPANGRMLPDQPLSVVLSVQQKAFHSFKVCARQSALESRLRIIDRRAYFLLQLGAAFCLLLAATIAMGSSLGAIYARGVGESDFSAAPSLFLIVFHRRAASALDKIHSM